MCVQQWRINQKHRVLHRIIFLVWGKNSTTKWLMTNNNQMTSPAADGAARILDVFFLLIDAHRIMGKGQFKPDSNNSFRFLLSKRRFWANLFFLFEAGRFIFSLRTCCAEGLDSITWALWLAPVSGGTTLASDWLNYSSRASNTFWQAFVAVGGGGRQLPTKPLVRTAVWFTADMIIPIVLQSLGWFTGVIGPEPPSSLLAINQSGELQRWNSLFCEASKLRDSNTISAGLRSV